MNKFIKKRKQQIAKEPKINPHLKKGDNVIVQTGEYAKKTGKILRRTNVTITIEGLNLKSKHVKRTKEELEKDNGQGSITKQEAPIHASNVQLCIDERPVKVFVSKESNGSRAYCYKNNEGNQIVFRSLQNTKSASR